MWLVNSLMNNMVQAMPIDYHTALVYGLHAKQAFDTFRKGIDKQAEADHALGR